MISIDDPSSSDRNDVQIHKSLLAAAGKKIFLWSAFKKVINLTFLVKIGDGLLSQKKRQVTTSGQFSHGFESLPQCSEWQMPHFVGDKRRKHAYIIAHFTEQKWILKKPPNDFFSKPTLALLPMPKTEW